MISDFSEDWKIIYSVEAQSVLLKNHNQVMILTVAVVVGIPGGNLIDEIHLVFLDHIDNINMNFWFQLIWIRLGTKFHLKHHHYQTDILDRQFW